MRAVQLKRVWLPALVATCAAMLAALILYLPMQVAGTPIYAGRSGRTCDNCHLDPNGWQNPSLSKRKCSMSCQACHVDPAGGGMRNTSGRFYGRATLAMIATSPRPTKDWDRDFLGLVYRKDRATTYTSDLPRGPNDPDESAPYFDSIKDPLSFGTPLGGPTKYALVQGRYGKLRAQPLFSIGWDLRSALLLSKTPLFFPMQGDVHVAVKPVVHLTAFVNTGFRGRISGVSETAKDPHTPYFREALVILGDGPYQSYVKAGRFTPAYGLRLDDHTSQIRRSFELDGSLPETRVTGVEIGAAPNYPFFNLGWFRTAPPTGVESFDIFKVGDGSGASLNAGIRHLGWSFGASALIRKRETVEGGNTSTFGAYGVINPGFYRSDLPIVYQVELDYGKRERASGLETTLAAFYQEIDWLAGNGVNFLVSHDWADPDREVVDDQSHRVSAGVQVTPYPGFTVDMRARILVPAGLSAGTDVFVQLHVWSP